MLTGTAADGARAASAPASSTSHEHKEVVGAPAASPMAGTPYHPSHAAGGQDSWEEAHSVSLSPTPLGSSFARASNIVYETDDGRDDPAEFLPNVVMNKTCLQSSSSSSAGTFCRLTEDQQVIATASEDSPYIIMDLEKLYYVDHISFGVNVDHVSEQNKLLVWCTKEPKVEPIADVSGLPFSWQKVVLQNSQSLSMHVHSPCSYLRIQRLSFGQLKVQDLRVFGAEIKNPESMGCMAGHSGALCSGHGTCADSQCLCDFGYGGAACASFLLSKVIFSSIQATALVAVFVYMTVYYRRRRSSSNASGSRVTPPGAGDLSVFGAEEDLDEADVSTCMVSKVGVLTKRSISAESMNASRTPAGNSFRLNESLHAPIRPAHPIRSVSGSSFASSTDQGCTSSLLPSLAPVSGSGPSVADFQQPQQQLQQEGVLHLLFASPLIMTGKEGSSNAENTVNGRHFRPVQGLDIKREYAMLRRSLRAAALSSNGNARSEVPVTVSCATVESFHSLMTLGNARCLHFSGHCTKNFIAFEDAAGQLHSVSMETLRGLLRSTVTRQSFKTLRLVVLNACNSDAAAREFVLAGVEHVIAYRKRVRDQVAAVFTRSFYLALACGRTVRDAFESAREAVQSSPSFAEEDMDAFVLLPENSSHREVIWKPSVQERKQVSRSWPLSDTMCALPPLCEEFLGRHAAMWTVLRHLTQDRRRLVAVHSEAEGAGKTQLALAVAHHLHQRRSATVMRDGIFYVKGVHHRTQGANDSSEAQITEMASLVDELWDAMYPLLSAETPAEQTMQRSMSSSQPSMAPLDADLEFFGFEETDSDLDAMEFSPHFYADRRAVSRATIEATEPLLSADLDLLSDEEESGSFKEDAKDKYKKEEATGRAGDATSSQRQKRLALNVLRRRAVAKVNLLARALAQHSARCLIVLDDFRESPLTMSVLHSILDQTSGVRILVTSENPLHLGHTLNVNVVNYQLQPMHAGDAALLFVRHLKRRIIVRSNEDPDVVQREATLQEVAQHAVVNSCEGNPREIIHLASDLSSNLVGPDLDLDASLAASL
ncbi:Hypothetical Protein FCC1311_100172 [Hondaea fermentalgiana]|uniref:CHAT domain-containing protein n=1 Tax=Hondaea fermentalgiana TaxID=2315210 RepID=A0A2R5H0F3_9STRA|nr:Hypothetical Protein FCC1311_100172 [Hondaea fermentalgiana]|eukprot:GBG33794.1 Hypothetical Protein FCC1311_100172 [Hondaea fermentalgiana]